MTEKELKKLNRKDLLQMLIEQSQVVQELRDELAEAQEKLEDKTIAIEESGSIAEAALKLNDLFKVSEDTCKDYVDNVAQLCKHREEESAKLEEESKAKAKSIIDEAEQKKVEIEKECAKMLKEASEQSQAYWDEVSENLEKFYEAHGTLEEALSDAPSQIRKPEEEKEEEVQEKEKEEHDEKGNNEENEE